MVLLIVKDNLFLFFRLIDAFFYRDFSLIIIYFYIMQFISLYNILILFFFTFKKYSCFHLKN
jgi:hypothetical protein